MEYRTLTPLLRRSLLIGGIVLAALMGAIAITHRTAPPVAATYTNPYLPGNPEPVSRDLGSAVPNAPVVSAVSPFGPSEPPPSYVPPPSVPATAELAPVYNAPVVETAATYRRTARRRYYTRSRVVRRRRTRPFSHSAAIVGGSAAGGAIVGGLVGGGKGAGIGALAGGAGGLVYDRATRKHR